MTEMIEMIDGKIQKPATASAATAPVLPPYPAEPAELPPKHLKSQPVPAASLLPTAAVALPRSSVPALTHCTECRQPCAGCLSAVRRREQAEAYYAARAEA